MSRHVDPFFIDSYEASFEPSTGALLAAFSADFFGTCHLRKAVVGNIEEDLKTMASVAFDVFERKSTECASNGTVKEADRPVAVPGGFTYHYVPCDE
ncbi:hypothetical protein OIU34_20930 [Pararhizobium sp. BT-229]|uniref:hypothetical protein n=1 Tax=Pararhizobium sp. BT-229 TaxID=2986923 RepID=UPI0021F6A536|nr:hypothetical protein [Pararhizobium sp. BT-229]MCV9964356.1 hypothetical protein [Pararhizobium sp. BT-229]